LGNLSTPKTVQKLQKALHAKAKAEAGYRFYALYDKISREDILAHAFAQCRSNKGAPGVDGQDFADIETYGVERWLGELAPNCRSAYSNLLGAHGGYALLSRSNAAPHQSGA
jgi:RNA-directed DNA polymerase